MPPAPWPSQEQLPLGPEALLPAPSPPPLHTTAPAAGSAAPTGAGFGSVPVPSFPIHLPSPDKANFPLSRSLPCCALPWRRSGLFLLQVPSALLFLASLCRVLGAFPGLKGPQPHLNSDKPHWLTWPQQVVCAGIHRSRHAPTPHRTVTRWVSQSLLPHLT